MHIIGSGVAGLATSIRLAKAGYQVIVFEKNETVGGKLAELKKGAYRFDKGPSLLTMPQLIEELQTLAAYPQAFRYKRLENITNYFFEDGTRVQANGNAKSFSTELQQKLGEDRARVDAYFKTSRFYFDSTFDLFLNQSLGQLRNFLNTKTLVGILRAPRLGLFTTMHAQNKKTFRNKKTVQIFDRYATYNGSSPYKAPALLNQIHHLELEGGAYLPEAGMRAIPEYLYELARYMGVEFQFNRQVEAIRIENDRVLGTQVDGQLLLSDLVVCNTDIHHAYRRLIPKHYNPEKILSQEKSSSAVVFYWGIKKNFPELGLHNILFSDNYQEEFKALFENDEPYHDPTIYINITSKLVSGDAPDNAENWFVMVNVPHNRARKQVPYLQALRKQVIDKLNRMLNTDLESLIEVEEMLDPCTIERETSSFGGSLYGNSSNNRFSAFRRHHNFHPRIKGLYFAGGSVHPGGGIPLCLLSGKIAANLIIQKNG